ncbi:MAG: hypothetical protein RI571_11465 [Roseovarius sp.]|nr:hypothetical protein [Roseovarius sp.]
MRRSSCWEAGYKLLVDGQVRVDVLQARKRPGGKARIDVSGHVVLLIPSMLALLYWSYPSVRNAWAIHAGAISVGGLPAVFLLKSLIPAFCGLLIVQSLACLHRNLLRLRA